MPEQKQRDTESRRRHYYRNREKILEATREWNYENLERRRELAHKYHHDPKNREKIRAIKAVNRAVKRGTLIRPTVCEDCGDEPKPHRDGRSAIQAHHDDYSQRFDVRWLCKSCHMERHRRMDPTTGKERVPA